MTSSATRRFDVAVIGAGVTGLSAAWHLASRGVSQIALSSSTKAQPATRLGTGLASAGYLDNFTRFSHHFGETEAAGLWRLGEQAFASLRKAAAHFGVQATEGRHVRLATGDDELVEARRAVAQLKAQGFSAALVEGKGLSLSGLRLDERVQAVQDDGAGSRALSIDAADLLDKVSAAVTAPRIPAVTHIRHETQGLVLEHDDGTTTGCEIAIVAAHLETARLVPEIASALVSVADQWTSLTFEGSDAFPESLIGTLFTAKHGHEWGGFTGKDRMILGGARYLRRWAGIEAERADAEPRISEHLLKLAVRTFGFGATPRVAGAGGFLDCRPCDELPIVGPMFGDGRVLVATGFLGSGLTLGWLAGDCLAELVVTGKSDKMPRRLWPERLRSLET